MAKIEGLKKSFNIQQVIEFIQSSDNPNIKWDVLLHYANTKNSNDIFQQLISSNLFSDAELFEKFIEDNNYYTKYPKRTHEFIAKRVNTIKYWTSFTSAEQVIRFRNEFIPEHEELYSKLKFFETENPTIYSDLIPTKPGYYYLKNFSEEQILSLNNEFIGYLNQTIDKDLAYLPYRFDFSDLPQASLFSSKKYAILKICMHDIENGANVLHKFISSRVITLNDFKGRYTIEEINSLPPVTKSIIKNPKNIWKALTNAEQIYYCIPEGKEWYVFEYFSVHNPSVMRKLIPFISTRDEVVNRYKNYPPEKLPQSLKDYISESIKLKELQIENGKKSAEALKQKALERKQAWLNGRGEIIQFFKLQDGIPIASKEEYIQIAYFFKETELSVFSFCKKYQIDDIEGFRTMLKKVSEEDESFKKYYEESAEKNQKNYVKTCANNISSIATDKSSIPAVIESSNSLTNLQNLVAISEYLSIPTEQTQQCIENIIEYYYRRLNSYNPNSANLEDIDKMLSFKEFIFLFQPETLSKIKSGKNVELLSEFTKSILPFRDSLSQNARQMLYSDKTGIRAKIKPYAVGFSREDYHKSKNTIIVNGAPITIDDSIIDMAECYAHNHNLFVSAYLMNKLIRAVADGQIQNQEETKQYKQELIDKILERVENCNKLSTVIVKKPYQPE